MPLTRSSDLLYRYPVGWARLNIEVGPLHHIIIPISSALTMTRYFANGTDILLKIVS